MPKKVPLVAIGVKREGVTIYPKVGEPFDFTDAELKDLTKLSKETKSDYFRSTVNEDGSKDDKPSKQDKADGKTTGKTAGEDENL